MVKKALKKGLIFGLALILLGFFLNLYHPPVAGESLGISMTLQALKLFLIGFVCEFGIDLCVGFAYNFKPKKKKDENEIELDHSDWD